MMDTSYIELENLNYVNQLESNLVGFNYIDVDIFELMDFCEIFETQKEVGAKDVHESIYMLCR